MSIDNATPEEWDKAAHAANFASLVATPHLNTVNATLDRPFGEVPLKFQCLAFALSQQGYPVMYWHGEEHGWRATPTPLWGPKMRYRIAAKPEEIMPPSIDWSHVAPEYRWLAQCENGSAYLSEGEPRIHHAAGVGWVFPGPCAFAAYFASFKLGKGDWTKLIVQRPEGA